MPSSPASEASGSSRGFADRTVSDNQTATALDTGNRRELQTGLEQNCGNGEDFSRWKVGPRNEP